MEQDIQGKTYLLLWHGIATSKIRGCGAELENQVRSMGFRDSAALAASLCGTHSIGTSIRSI